MSYLINSRTMKMDLNGIGRMHAHIRIVNSEFKYFIYYPAAFLESCYFYAVHDDLDFRFGLLDDRTVESLNKN